MCGTPPPTPLLSAPFAPPGPKKPSGRPAALRLVLLSAPASRQAPQAAARVSDKANRRVLVSRQLPGEAGWEGREKASERAGAQRWGGAGPPSCLLPRLHKAAAAAAAGGAAGRAEPPAGGERATLLTLCNSAGLGEAALSGARGALPAGFFSRTRCLAGPLESLQESERGGWPEAFRAAKGGR